jgi:hypothetical protein
VLPYRLDHDGRLQHPRGSRAALGVEKSEAVSFPRPFPGEVAPGNRDGFLCACDSPRAQGTRQLEATEQPRRPGDLKEMASVHGVHVSTTSFEILVSRLGRVLKNM